MLSVRVAQDDRFIIIRFFEGRLIFSNVSATTRLFGIKGMTVTQATFHRQAAGYPKEEIFYPF
jgi:hypothetical protein